MVTVEVGRTRRGRLTVPPGWTATVPTIHVARDDARFQEMMRTLTRFGASPIKAEEIAREGCQRLFTGSWTTKLKMYVGRAAEVYVESFGDLEGFDPEVVQGLFLPHADVLAFKGRRGDFVLRDAFRRMR